MDFIVFSHLRWDFVYQRPQHLLTRAAKRNRVFFWEEPVFEDGIDGSVAISERPGGVVVCVAHLPHGLNEEDVAAAQTQLLGELLERQNIREFATWYYTPMALNF